MHADRQRLDLCLPLLLQHLLVRAEPARLREQAIPLNPSRLFSITPRSAFTPHSYGRDTYFTPADYVFYTWTLM